MQGQASTANTTNNDGNFSEFGDGKALLKTKKVFEN